MRIPKVIDKYLDDKLDTEFRREVFAFVVFMGGIFLFCLFFAVLLNPVHS